MSYLKNIKAKYLQRKMKVWCNIKEFSVLIKKTAEKGSRYIFLLYHYFLLFYSLSLFFLLSCLFIKKLLQTATPRQLKEKMTMKLFIIPVMTTKMKMRIMKDNLKIQPKIRMITKLRKKKVMKSHQQMSLNSV